MKKAFNADRAINSQLKFIFVLFLLATLVLMIQRGEYSAGMSLHPWLSGIMDVNQHPAFGWIVLLRVLFIVVSTFLVWLISTRHLEVPRKDYLLFFILPVIHFTVVDWSIGLLVAIYWTTFLLVLFMLFPVESVRPTLRTTLTAAICCGFLLLNGAFALLFFLAGIVIMIISQSISFRRVLIWLTGFLTPAFFMLFYYFLTDQTGIILENAGAFILGEQMLQFNFPITFYSCPALLFVLMIMVHARLSEFKISVRRSYSALLFSLIALSPAILSSLINTHLLFAIYGLTTVFYWIKAVYITRRRAIFIILLLMPVLFPLLYYFLLNYTVK